MDLRDQYEKETKKSAVKMLTLRDAAGIAFGSVFSAFNPQYTKWLEGRLNKENTTDEKTCAKLHEMFQDKDDLCPFCNEPWNPDF